ncbi:MAG: hypothetical protein CL957_03050 [Euryarchaeota archaeon]|nr:hypothetical protein [Euryarchaeota archaeon]
MSVSPSLSNLFADLAECLAGVTASSASPGRSDWTPSYYEGAVSGLGHSFVASIGSSLSSSLAASSSAPSSSGGGFSGGFSGGGGGGGGGSGW